MTKISNTYKIKSGIFFSLILTISSLTPVFATTHIVLFGGDLGATYSPNFLTVTVGDTVQWHGSFDFHPLSSATIPVGANTWSVSSGSVFSYPVLIVGTYDYRCDLHGDFGMVGSFVAVAPTPIDAPNLLSPTNTSTGIPTNPILIWNSTTGATKYHLQVSFLSDFLIIVNESTNLTDTSKQLSGLNNNTLYFWRVKASNDLTTSAWSAILNFKTILSTPIAPRLISPDSAAVNQPTSVVLTWRHAVDADSYFVQLAGDQLFTTIIRNSTNVDSFIVITDLGRDSTYYWRISSKNILGISPWSMAWQFRTIPNAVTFQLNNKWNMVSIPLHVDDARLSTLFPDAVSSAFFYNNGYFGTDTLKNRKGYWIKFNSGHEVTIGGNLLERDTINVATGWNMVGSISTTIPVSSVTSLPGGISSSPFYTYNGISYVTSDSIKPGRAYWMKSSQNGKIILAPALSKNTNSNIIITLNSEKPPAAPEQVPSIEENVPEGYSLLQNYPIPFNPVTTIGYNLPERTFLKLTVSDVLGNQVATLVNNFQEKGYHAVTFDGTGLGSGVYFYRLTTSYFSEVKRLTLVK